MKMVEATLLIPLTIMIIVMLIGLMMSFYGNLGKAVSDHEEARKSIYETEIDW